MLFLEVIYFFKNYNKLILFNIDLVSTYFFQKMVIKSM